jgi:hypothetical protein
MLIRFLTFFCLSLGPPALGEGLNLRPDLNSLGARPCQNPDTYEFWKKGIFDSQVSISIYEFKKSLSEDMARTLAAKSSLTKKHRGFGFGHCNNTKHYIITTPSPVNYASLDLEKKLKESCRSAQVDATTESHSSIPQKLPLMQLPNQGISVTCFLVNTTQEWFLLPPINLSRTTDNLDFLTWINLKRSGLNLQSLSSRQELNSIANELNQKNTPLHDRNAIEKALKGLRNVENFKKTNYLYEDRASGKTIGEIKDILWWSPRHRDLLLKPSGKYLGIHQTAQLQISLVISD